MPVDALSRNAVPVLPPIVTVPLWLTVVVFSHSTVPPIVRPETVVAVPSVSRMMRAVHRAAGETVGAGQREFSAGQIERAGAERERAGVGQILVERDVGGRAKDRPRGNREGGAAVERRGFRPRSPACRRR